jgi:PTS system nitrogen regulatory IIA component
MKSDRMNARQAAEYARLTEKELTRLAANGVIAARKLSGQWQFERAALDKWLANRAPTRIEAARAQTATPVAEPGPLVSECLAPDQINLELVSTNRNGILRELVALVIEPHEKRLAETLYQALKAREDLCPTCVNEGVAVPHSRNAIVGLVERPVVAYGRHTAGIDFGALDGKPVHHFFLLCAPNVREHLQTLAQLARLVRSRPLREKLLKATSPVEALKAIRDAEKSAAG